MLDRLRSSVLRAFRDELVELADSVAASVVTVRLGTAELGGGTGSGWFIEPGVIVTNHHVVDGDSPSVKVRLRGGKLITAQIVGTDRSTDLAVLRCDERDIPPIEVRDKPARAGELCFAFGSPLGEFTESVTFGIVSGLGRRLPLPDGRSIENVLQTDAEINPGNSGGPLCNLKGEVVAINTAIIPYGTGLGFCIPIYKAKAVADQLIKDGKIRRTYIGVMMKPIDAALQKDFGMPSREGAFIQSVAPNSPAAQAQLKIADVIRKIDGQTMPHDKAVSSFLATKKIGDAVKIEILRNNSVQKTVTLKIAERPNDD